MRRDGRKNDEKRLVTIETDYVKHPEGSVLISYGETKVICSATVEEKLPPFMRGTGKGWIHAEYSMLPRATHFRTVRESAKGKMSGRTMEIQRLIARSLRAVVDLEALGERTITIDCDVIQADGGTRTASITGAFVALQLAVRSLLRTGKLLQDPVKENIAAVSAGIVKDGQVVLDLDYSEDSTASVDLNLVMTSSGKIAEIQGTGEEMAFSVEQLTLLLDIGKKGITELIRCQNDVLRQKQMMTNKDLNQRPAFSVNEIVIATHNNGKAREFEALFAKKGWKIKTLNDFPEMPEVEETGTSFAENALLKAETIADKLNMLVLADDSGLKVDALDGAPGIFSARYAGEPKSDAANNAKLLHELTDVPYEKRTAQFHCTLALAAPGKKSMTVSGEVSGTILGIPRGENGFGYDPLFYVAEKNKTMAELSNKEKNRLSHRSAALRKLDKEWKSWLSDE